MKRQNIWFAIFIVLLYAGIFICPLYNILGIPCLTCGMTRAWKSVVALDLSTAFSMHPLFLLPLVIFIPKLRKKWVLQTVLGLFIVVYIIRMILLFPHTPPMNFNYNSLLGGLLK